VLLCLLLVLTGSPALALCRSENRVWGFSEKPADFASYETAKPIDTPSENPGCGYDFASGVHKYLYCQDDPVIGRDPSGHEEMVEFEATAGLEVTAEEMEFENGLMTAVVKQAAQRSLMASIAKAAPMVGLIMIGGDEGEPPKIPYYRYDRSGTMTSFGPGTDITSRGTLSFSEALSISYQRDVDTLYMYTILTSLGDVAHHPDGPFVGNVPQFKLVSMKTFPDVILTRTLKKGQ